MDGVVDALASASGTSKRGRGVAPGSGAGVDAGSAGGGPLKRLRAEHAAVDVRELGDGGHDGDENNDEQEGDDALNMHYDNKRQVREHMGKAGPSRRSSVGRFLIVWSFWLLQ